MAYAEETRKLKCVFPVPKTKENEGSYYECEHLHHHGVVMERSITMMTRKHPLSYFRKSYLCSWDLHDIYKPSQWNGLLIGS
uniref:Uncharacterized protein n=1 Tax=Sphaerodactylus townsendi TaxID=933632 RepID=A0ACB8E4U7_9SAUR